MAAAGSCCKAFFSAVGLGFAFWHAGTGHEGKGMGMGLFLPCVWFCSRFSFSCRVHCMIGSGLMRDGGWRVGGKGHEDTTRHDTARYGTIIYLHTCLARAIETHVWFSKVWGPHPSPGSYVERAMCVAFSVSSSHNNDELIQPSTSLEKLASGNINNTPTHITSINSIRPQG